MREANRFQINRGAPSDLPDWLTEPEESASENSESMSDLDKG